MFYPTLEDYCSLAKEGGVVPVFSDIIADQETPMSLYRKLRVAGNPSFLLESITGGAQVSRYSFIGLESFDTFTVRGREIHSNQSDHTLLTDNAFDALRHWTQRHAPGPETLAFAREHLPPFFGGAVGYLGYEMVSHIEQIPIPADKETPLPDAQFIMTRCLAAFDHATNRLKLIVNTLPGSDPEATYRDATNTITALQDRMQQEASEEHAPSSANRTFAVSSSTGRADFLRGVERAKEYIQAGDIFQVVLSQRLETPLTTSSLQVYRYLRSLNPSPYMFHLDLPDVTLVGASPEMLVKVIEGKVELRPLAGTRPRGGNAQEDRQLEEEMLADEKEQAEHIMLVDLGRNDVGRVAEYGSVEVTELLGVERYSHVMHLVSHVRGILREDADAIDALMACFPAGTLSGAPKIRAMEIIAETEPHRRGPYGGAVGYFSFSGNLDSCITIRTVVIHNGKAYVQAGAGIVADSKADMEYHETLNKARGLLTAIEQAERNVLP